MVLPYLRLVFGCGDVPDFFMCGGQSMGFFELFLIGIGLSMDAFAVAICKGLGMERINKRDTLLLALFFGGFQALMPLTGYLLGSRFASYIERWDHWIAFVLLAFIGGNMIRESREQEEEEIEHGGSIRYRELFTLAVATSIDALAVGVSFAFLGVHIAPAVTLIGCTTFVLTLVGVWVGNLFGSRYKSRAELTGGIILILIGVKILLEHLGVLG
jgi:putative Mn2+ efflux pump MntP